MSIHSSLPSVRATSPRVPANPAQTVLLPNENILPTAGISAKSSEEIFPYRTEFVTKFGPQISLLLVSIFGVNRRNMEKSVRNMGKGVRNMEKVFATRCLDIDCNMLATSSQHVRHKLVTSPATCTLCQRSWEGCNMEKVFATW
jgi:hypothetical protein